MSSRKEQKEEARRAREAKEAEHAAQHARTRRLSIIGGVALLALIAIVVAVVVSVSSNKSPETSAAQINARYAGLTQKGTTLGEPAAKATIVEFGDLRCPICKQFEDDAMPTVVDELIKTGKAKLVFNPWPILDGNSPSGADSTNAAKYTLAVSRQNKMFPFINLFYAEQQAESTDYANEEFLTGLAKQIPGLDGQKAWEAHSDPKISNELAANDALATKLGATGTPTFYVGADEDSIKPVEMSDYSDPQPIIDAVNALQ